jgi:hypothetical protein
MGSRFEDATVDRMLENFQRILVELITNADVSSISYQLENERQTLIDSFNQSLANL